MYTEVSSWWHLVTNIVERRFPTTLLRWLWQDEKLSKTQATIISQWPSQGKLSKHYNVFKFIEIRPMVEMEMCMTP